jgi:hypothetical protein
MALEVDLSDVEYLVQPDNKELTTEDLQEFGSFTEHHSGEEKQNYDVSSPLLRSKNF